MRHLLLAALLSAPAASLAAQSVQGYRYTLVMRDDDDDEIIATAHAAGPLLRLDFPDKDGQYLLSDARQRTVTIVRPAEREYSVTSDSGFERILETAMEAASVVVNLDVRDVRVAGERLGPGEAIGGRATQRYRLTQEFTVRVGALGITGETMRHRITTEYWVAPDVELPRNPVVELLASVESVLAQHDAEFVRRTREARRTLFRGTPLRLEVTAQRLDEPDDAETRTIEVADLQRVTLEPWLWRVPRDYERREIEIAGWKLF